MPPPSSDSRPRPPRPLAPLNAARIAGLLIPAASVLLLALWISRLDPSWLANLGFNPFELPAAPHSWGLDDPWRTLFAPLALAGALALLLPALPRRPWSQVLALALLIAFALRYLLWRTTTLGGGGALGWALTLPMLLTEILYIGHRLFPFVPALLFDPQQRRRQADRLMADASGDNPAVDVWIVVKQEPERLVRRALLSCRSLEPAPAAVVLIDLAGRTELDRLAADLGAVLRRPQPGEGRAAVLNRLLNDGGAPVIAMFDGNFMPLRPFLRRTLGFLHDERVAMVQTPQRHFHSEFWNRNLGVDLVMPGYRDTFFHYLEVIRDRCNAVLGCGTSWIARRQALIAAGGFLGSAGRIEDQQTSTRLLTQGWRVVYLDEVLSLGEEPHTFLDYLQERLHGLQADLQTFLMPRQLPIWSTLGPWPRCFFLDQLLDLLTPLLRALYLLLPLLALLLDVPLIDAPLIVAAAYGLPFLIAYHTIPEWLSEGRFTPFWHEVHETLVAFPALARLPGLLADPFRPLAAPPEAEAGRRSSQSLNLSLAWPFLLLLLVLIGVLLIRYTPDLLPGAPLQPLPGYQGESANLIWNLANGWLLLVCLLCCIDQPVRQGGDRVVVSCPGRLRLDAAEHPGRTGDLSETGASFRLDDDGSPPAVGDGWLELAEPPLQLPVRIVRRGEGGTAGLLFRPMDPATNMALLNLLYGAAETVPPPRRTGFLTALRSLAGGLWRAEPILRQN